MKKIIGLITVLVISIGVVAAFGVTVQARGHGRGNSRNFSNSNSGSVDVANWSFENPAVVSSLNWDVFPSPDVPGWTVEWTDAVADNYGGMERPDPAHLEVHTEDALGVAPVAGSQYIELDSDWDGPGGGLNGEPANVMVSQNLDTEGGMTYRLTYWYRERPKDTINSSYKDSEMGVYVDGLQVASHLGSSGWQMGSFVFTADGSTEIGFKELGVANSFGMFLDNVRVSKVTGWNKSSLEFLDQGYEQGEVWATIWNGGDGDMSGPVEWELYYAEKGNPKFGEIIASGNVPALESGENYTIWAPTMDPGNYMFKAYQRPGHPGRGELWSEAIEVE